MALLPVTVTEAGDWSIVRIEEASLMDAAVIEALNSHVESLLQAGHIKLILDFEEVQYISSSMIGVLVGARQTIAKAEGQLILCRLNKRLVELLKLTRLHKMFVVEDTLGSAKQRAGIAES